MIRKLTIQFDNGGGMLLQTPSYCHYYDDPRHLAEDIAEVLKGANPRDWDGNEPEFRNDEVHPETKVVNLAMIRRVMAGGELPNRGHAESDFWEALTDR